MRPAVMEGGDVSDAESKLDGAAQRSPRFKHVDSRKLDEYRSLEAMRIEVVKSDKVKKISSDELIDFGKRLFWANHRFPDVKFIAPTDCSPYWSDAAAYDVVKQVHMHLADRRDSFNPIIIFFSTASAVSVGSSFLEGLPNDHYSAAVILPSVDEEMGYQFMVHYFSSLPGCFFPERVMRLLVEGGTSVFDASTKTLPALSMDFTSHVTQQQNNSSASAYWSLYNTYMSVATVGKFDLSAFTEFHDGVSSNHLVEILTSLPPARLQRAHLPQMEVQVDTVDEIALKATRAKFVELCAKQREAALKKLLFEQQRQMRLGRWFCFPMCFVAPISPYLEKVIAMDMAVLDFEMIAAKENINDFIEKNPELLQKFQALNEQMDMELELEEATLAYQRIEEDYMRWNYSEKAFPRATVFSVAVLNVVSTYFSSKLEGNDTLSLKVISEPATFAESIVLSLSLLAVQLVAAVTLRHKKALKAAEQRRTAASDNLRSSIVKHGHLLSNIAFMVNLNEGARSVRGASRAASPVPSEVDGAAGAEGAASSTPVRLKKQLSGMPMELLEDGGTVVSALGATPDEIAFRSVYLNYVTGGTKDCKNRLRQTLHEQRQQLRVGRWLCCLPYCFVAPLGRKAVSAFAEALAVVHRGTLDRVDHIRALSLSGGVDSKKCQAMNQQLKMEICANRTRLMLQRKKVKYNQWNNAEKSLPKFSVFILAVSSALFVYLTNSIDKDDTDRLLEVTAAFVCIEGLITYFTQYIGQTFSSRTQFHKERLDYTKAHLSKIEHEMHTSQLMHGKTLVGDLARVAEDDDLEKIAQGVKRSDGLAL